MKIDPNHTGESTHSNTTSHHNPMLPVNHQLPLSIALTRSQFANECGGVLIDPNTQEVCLLFYPDTSEWRLPIGRPNTMSSVFNLTVANFHLPNTTYESPEPSAAGCEPMAHAAQHQISLITGYKCSHIHPKVSSQAIKPEQQCAFTGGPQMVEPLVLHIEQRALPAALPSNASKRVQRSKTLPPTKAAVDTAVVAKPKERKSALMLIPPINSGDDFSSTLQDDQIKEEDTEDKQTEDVEDDDDLPLAAPSSANSQYVMTHYYIAWLAQSRFDSKSGSSLPVSGSKRLPLAEVTWFKMDTAAQVLTHNTDKLALREAIQRMVLLNKKPFNEAQFPFVCSSAMLDQLTVSTKSATVQISGNNNGAGPDTTTSGNASPSSESTAEDSGTTRNTTPTRMVSPAASRNIDIIRRTATSLSRRGGLLGKVSRASTNDAQLQNQDKSKKKKMMKAKEEDADADNQTRNSTGGVPRMLSIFYKLTGIST